VSLKFILGQGAVLEEEEKIPEMRSAERRMEISERVSSQKPEVWHDDTTDSKRQQEIKPPKENKVPGELLQY